MRGTVTERELTSALRLDESLKSKLSEYEKSNWAANISSVEVRRIWTRFVKELGVALRENRVNDSDLVDFIHYLSTIDTVVLLAQLGKLDESMKTRFLQLLNWVSQKSPELSQRLNAQSVVDRILMAYRLETYPTVYSEERLAKAFKCVQNMKDS